MREVLGSVRNPVLLVGNDAQQAGAPLLLLGLASRMRAHGWSPVFILRRAGPLFDRFAAAGPTLIADEGWDLAAVGREVPRLTPILANTGWGGQLVADLGLAPRAALLVHEMPAYLREHDLLDPLASMHTVVASMPATQAQLSPLLGPLSGERSRLRTIVPGVHPPARSRAGARGVRERMQREFGTGAPVFLSAGYADHRKGFDLFLDAAKRIALVEPAAAFVWLGETSSWARALADDALDHGLRLLLPGFVPAPADWYAAAAVYLLTSRQDPGPTTVVDAACTGVPFVALEADIGLRSLHEVVERTGEFVSDVGALAGRAIEVARTDTEDARSARGEFGRSHRSFERYAGEILDVLGEVRGETMRLGWGQRLLARVQLTTVTRVGDPALRRRLLRVLSIPGRARRRLRKALRALTMPPPRRERLASVAVLQSPPPSSPARTRSEEAEAHSIGPGGRVWIAGPQVLASLENGVDLHIVREPGTPAWQLLGDVEAGARRIHRVVQHDATRPPLWVADRRRPPRPRRPVARALPSRESAWLAPRGSIRLARPIGVFVHAYYLDVAAEIAARLQLIDHPKRVYVSTDTAEKAGALVSVFPDAVVRVFPNRGADVYPKVFGYAAEHADHDLVLHLHTKRSAHSSHLAGWLPFLLDCLLPSTTGVNGILAAFDEVPALGMVSPSHFPSLGAATNWGPNRAIAEVLTWGRGWPKLPENGDLVFPAGSMFWAQASALAPLQTFDIPVESFASEASSDGTVAHAVERLLGVSCEAAGMQQLVVGRPEGTAGLATADLLRQRRFRS